MFIGHYGAALAAKKYSPKIPLAALFFATQFIDLIWPFLLLSGVEVVKIAPGITAVTPLDFVHYPYSHSLLMVIVWGAVVGGGWYALRRDARVAAVLAALVVSHWILDFVTHRPDLPLYPGGMKVGLGLWNVAAASMIVELGIFAGGIALYLDATKAKSATGKWALWSLVALLLFLWLGAMFGPPPPGATELAGSALLMWLFIPWAVWIEAKRESAPSAV